MCQVGMYPVGTRRHNDVEFWLSSGRDVAQRHVDVAAASLCQRCASVTMRRSFDVEIWLQFRRNILRSKHDVGQRRYFDYLFDLRIDQHKVPLTLPF